MSMNRRSFLTGLIAAPVVITTPGLLMPVRSFADPYWFDLPPFDGLYFVQDFSVMRQWSKVGGFSPIRTITPLPQLSSLQ